VDLRQDARRREHVVDPREIELAEVEFRELSQERIHRSSALQIRKLAREVEALKGGHFERIAA
jgi:hypothetical protein